ncbi:unnamed protein product [Penicillium nalgiovense]|uniref:Uncharacterized protein n=1 Tax=Penicillium nalgiovense TaxID=60175 RepID=A0A9W4IBU9_PENNA|nr:unnamed protein product [Penicillium nalgiovense]CAG8028035.1 unnamed protein product [Penicillium nalgiovense]CAG8056881.1 unnamed protein product [Penicillium nalgiovense]CAG8086625.1 unnamed protein product [Penicillium nalgiovense]CAG8122346.1 unnamed protein product [Penicillium nalgiovense]
MSAFDDNTTAILAPEDAALMQESGLVTPSSSEGTRWIHKRRLNRSSDEEEQHLPLTPVSTTSSSSSFVSIPDHLISFATLLHLGYNSQTATHIWENWNNWPSWGPMRESDDIEYGVPFIDFAKGHIGSALDTCEDDDAQWFHCMELYGISNELREAIMDPKFRQIRLTESCKFWVQDTFKLRYRGLKAVQAASREREMANRREASRPGQTRSTDSGQRSISDSLRMAPWLSHETALSPAATSAAENAPGYTTLFKGVDRARVETLFQDSKRVLVGCLGSRQPSDFVPGGSGGIYFAIDREVAEYYASYTKRRDGCSAVVIVQLTIPNPVIESLPTTRLQRIYWRSEQWKAFIFHSRREEAPLPSKLRKYHVADLLIGSICRRPTHIFANMKSPDEVTERMVFKLKDGRNAVQYVFKGQSGYALLQGSGSFTIFPLTTREFEAWYNAV